MLNEGDLLRLILLGERDRFRGCGDLECLRIDRERDLNIKSKDNFSVSVSPRPVKETLP